MFRNRLTADPAPLRLPQAPPPPVTPAGFMLFPLAAVPTPGAEHLAWQQWLYQRAFELAQAVARPSLPERDLLGVWN